MEKNVELHLHTDAYWKGSGDAAETVVEAIDAAAKAGATSVAITDHGNCANWVDFFNYARGGEVDHQSLLKKNLPTVKPIMGCELYVEKEDSYYEGHSKKMGMHLIVLAKDYIGFQQISRAISEANRHRDAGRPQLTLDLLRASFADPGHVICMSACIAGPLANELLWNNRVEREIRKEEKKIKDREAELGEEYFQAKKIFDGVNQKIDQLTEEKERLTPISKKTGFKRAVAAAKKEENEGTREFMLSEIAKEECETKEAKARIKEINEQIKDFKNFMPENGLSYKEAKKILTKAKNKLGTIEVCENRIAEMKGNLRSEEECIKNATNVALLYKEIFSDFFIELQYHGIQEEAYVMPILVDIAKDCGIRTTITNDVHILKGEVKALELNRNAAQLKGKWMQANVGDEELYYKTDDEKKEFLSQILPMDVIEESIQTTHEVAAACNLDTLSEGKHYPKFKDADKKLRELAEFGSTVAETESGIRIQISDPRSGIAAKYGSLDEKKRARMERELDTISKMGFSSYFLFIADVILKCKTAREIATDIGPARGSGAGSIVCYLCGITELEPMGLNLLFERFLNPERVSMPDIDTDFSKFARQFAIDYVTKTYGQKAVAGIMTKGKFGAKQALTYAPKLYAKEQGLDIKTYADLGAKMRSFITDDQHLSDIEENIKSMENEDATKIFAYAKMLEGKISSYGQHAAGVIAIMDGAIEDYIPLMMAKDQAGNEKLVIQADMVAAEAQLGFIKFDFLGLKNLNVITACQKMVYEKTNKFINIYNLKLDDAEVYEKIFQRADTNFVFQFESDGMKKMLTQLHPTTFGDLVLAVSVYRPGPMDFIPAIIECKNSGKPSEMVAKIPLIADILKETYGYPVYQEQIMQIFMVAAGFTLGKADNVRRFMSKKKEDKLAEVRPEFVAGCAEHGISGKDANWLFDQMMPFAKYGFNKSHAAAYSLVSYATAWFKCHFPAEYLAAVMLEQGDKTMQFLSDCKKYDISVLPVDVNLSGENYTVENGNIRIGLSAIKGLSASAETIVKEREHGAFPNIRDFIERCDLKSNEFEACILSGACDGLTRNRENAVSFMKQYLDLLGDRDKAMMALKEATDANRLKKWNESLEEAEKSMKALVLRETFSTSDDTKRALEMEYLNMFLSGSPLDDIEDDPRYKDINDLDEDDAIITLGIVSKYRAFKTKTGDTMATFSLITKKSDVVPVVVFPKTFEELDEISDNMIVEISGKVSRRDEELQIIANSVKSVVVEKKNLFIHTNSFSELVVLLDLLQECESRIGYSVSIKVPGSVRKLAYNVSTDVIDLLAHQFEYKVM